MIILYEVGLELLQIIESHGYQAYMVGGFVRDYYLKRKCFEIDISTRATPLQLKEILPTLELPKNDYQALRFYFKGVNFELVTWRCELEYKGRRPVTIVYTDDLMVDLRRRDFTINALCINQHGELIDYLGGYQDLNQKLIRMIGDPMVKLKEDNLRLLRAIRFATVLDFNLELQLVEAIKRTKQSLKQLSGMRKRQELDLIFGSKNVQKGVYLILELGLELPLGLNNLREIHVIPSVMGMWAQLNLNPYPFTKQEKELILKIRACLKESLNSTYPLYKYGLKAVQIASLIKGIGGNDYQALYQKLPIKTRAEIKLKGKEICQLLGRQQGPWLNQLYEELALKIITGALINTKAALTKYILSYEHTLE